MAPPSRISDAVPGERPARLHDELRGVDRHIARPIALGARFRRQFGQLGGAILHELGEARPGRARRVLERGDELRHHPAQIAHQRHIDRTVDADRGRVLLDVDPLADRFVGLPVAPAPIVHRLAQFGAEREAQVRLFDRFDRRIGEHVLEGAVLQPFDVRRPARSLDHRAVHQQRQFLDRRAHARGVDRVADQQDRVFRRADRFGGLVNHVDVRALVDQAIARRAAAVRPRRVPQGSRGWGIRYRPGRACPTWLRGSPAG